MGKQFNKFVKLIIGRPDIMLLKLKLKKRSMRKALLIGSPVHNNLGDHLIADNCIKFINDLGFEEIIDIPEFYYDLFGKTIKINSEDVVFVVGGGWLGNDYEDANIICRIIRQWPNNKIVILPQTIYFSASGKYASETEISDALNSTNKVMLCVRESLSYKTALDVLKISEKKVLLSPDITLYNPNYYPYHENKRGVILSIRNDRELVDNKLIFTIKNALKEMNIDYYESSTVVCKKIVPRNFRKRIIKNKIEQYGKCDLVITNRLHSMIFAILGGTKCLALDNSTHKVRETVKKWLFDDPNIIFISTSDYFELKSAIKTVSDMKYIEYCFAQKEVFENLLRNIGDFINE